MVNIQIIGWSVYEYSLFLETYRLRCSTIVSWTEHLGKGKINRSRNKVACIPRIEHPLPCAHTSSQHVPIYMEDGFKILALPQSFGDDKAGFQVCFKHLLYYRGFRE